MLRQCLRAAVATRTTRLSVAVMLQSRRFASATPSQYTLDDFLNEDTVVAPSKPKMEVVAAAAKPPAAEPKSATAATTSPLEMPTFRAPHSLSEFLVRCDELVVDAKRHRQDAVRQKRLREFWSAHVSRCIEMNVRNGHDLACVANAGRAFGLVLPSSSSSSSASDPHSNSAFYAAWAVVQRYRDVTRCAELIASLRLLVCSQPHIGGNSGSNSGSDSSTISQPKTRMYNELPGSSPSERDEESRVQNLLKLQVGHQRFALESIRHFFVEEETDVVTKRVRIRCREKDATALPDVLVILDAFTQNCVEHSSAAAVSAQRHLSAWREPPTHIAQRIWAMAGLVHRRAVPVCAPELRFSELVRCLIESRRLFARSRIVLAQANKDFASGNSSSSKYGKRHAPFVAALQEASRGIRAGAMQLFDTLMVQIDASGGSKLANSFHFVEIVAAADAMSLLGEADPSAEARRTRSLALLRDVFRERTGTASHNKWHFSAATHAKLCKSLGM